MKLSLLASTCVATIAACAFPAAAQQSAPAPAQAAVAPGGDTAAASTGLGDIVVTAQRRSESLQRAAIAVTAVTGDTLAAAGVTRPTELTALVPALQVAPAAGPYNLFYLRGVGNFNGNALSDSAIAFNADGVYVGRPSSTTGFFYDLERVEVVKGPQGTLYGRNATGGAINVISKKPQLGELGASVSGEYGNYDALRLDASVNAPLGDNAAVRAAAIKVRRDGYMNDGTDDQNDWGGRLSFRYEPVQALHITVVGDYFRQKGKGVGSSELGIAGQANAFGPDQRIGFLSPQGQALYTSQPNLVLGRTFSAIPANLPPYQDNKYWGISSTIDWQSSLGTLTIIPAYREGHLDYRNYLPGFFIQQKENSKQTSLEGRFATSDQNPLRALIGAFYYNENTRDPNVYYEHQTNFNSQTINLKTESEAIFGRLTYAIAPEFRLTAGGRQTWESKDFSGVLTAATRACVRPSSYFPTYVPGCPTAQPIPYGTTLPAFNFVPGADGTVTVPTIIDASGANSRHKDFQKFTYRFGADWDITPRNLLYASYETGFKSGGFFFSADSGVFLPETIKALTLGSKNRFWNNRLQINMEAFYWWYRNQQVSHLSVDSKNNSIFPTENVGKATFKGFEIDAQLLPVKNLTLTADLQYLDGKYNSFVYTTPNQNGGVSNGTGCPNASAPTNFYTVDCSGFRPPNAPQWTINLGAQGRLPLQSGSSIVADGRAHYQSRTLTGLEFQPVEYQKAYWTVDTGLTFYAPERRFFVGVFANNLFDKAVIGGTFPTAFSLIYTGSMRPPRTYGARAGAKF